MNYRPHTFPVSVKGVVVRDGRVLLLLNGRDEWELPGGKLELGEEPAACVVREVAEEVGWRVTAGPLVDAWQYRIRDGIDVLVLTYGCFLNGDAEPRVSHEHKEAGFFTVDQLSTLHMPQGYKRSIRSWFAQLQIGP